MTVEELQVIVTARTQGLQRQMSDLTRQLQGVQRQSNTMSTNMSRTFTTLKRTLVGLGIGKAIKSMFDLSRTYEAATQQVNRIFRDNASAIEAWIAKNATTFGMARADAMEYASIYGNLVKGFERDTSRMAQYTTQLMEATTVIASSTGRTVQDVSERIRSGLLGNTEAIEDLGIYANVAMIKTTDAFKTVANGRTWEKLTYQEQQQIRLMSILEQSASQFGTNIQQNTNYQLMQLTANLKNIGLNLGNAFMPIVSVVLPCLNSMALALANVTAKLAAFMNALFGTSFNAGAGEVKQVAADLGKGGSGASGLADGMDSAADSADKAGKAAKKAGKTAKNALANFDEINSLAKDNGGAGSGSGDGGGAGGSGTGVIESTAMSDAAESFADKVGKEIERLKGLFKEGFEIGLGDKWKFQVEDIKKSIQGIKDSLKDIFTDPQVVASARNLADSIALNLGKVTGSVVSIGTTIAQNLLGGINKYLDQNKEFIKQRLVGIMDATSEIADLAGNFAVAFADVFSVFGGETAQQITANIIGIFSNAALGCIEIITKLAADILGALTKPFVDNKDLIKTTLEGMLVPIETITGSLKQTVDDTFATFSRVYDEHIGPAFDNITTGFTNLVENILTNYNTYIAPVIEGLATKFDELMQGPIQGFIDSVIENIGKIIDNGSILWKDTLEPLIAGLNDTLAPVIGDIVEKFGNFALILAEDLFNAATNVMDAIGSISDWCVENKGVIEDIAAVIIAWGAAWATYELFQKAGTVAMLAWEAGATIASAATTAFGTAIAFLTSPITLTVAAIAAVIAIAVLLVKHWDDIKEAAGKCWDWIVEKWNAAGEWFNTTVVEPIKKFFSGLWEWIKQVAQQTWEGLKVIWQVAGNWFNTGVITPIKTFFTQLWENLKQTASTCWQGIQSAWQSASTWFNSSIITPIKNAFTDWSNNIKQLATTAWNGVKSAWQSASSWFTSTIVTPIKTGFQNAWTTITSLATACVSGIKSVFQSFKSWIDSIISGIKSAFSSLWSGIADGCRSAMNGVLNKVESGINNMTSKVNSVTSKVGINIPSVKVPKLARGGIVDSSTFMGNYIAGEAGKEMIVPLENTAFTDKIATAMGQAVMNAMSVMLNSSGITGNNGQNVNLEMDGTVFARTITPYIVKEMKRLKLI